MHLTWCAAITLKVFYHHTLNNCNQSLGGWLQHLTPDVSHRKRSRSKLRCGSRSLMQFSKCHSVASTWQEKVACHVVFSETSLTRCDLPLARNRASWPGELAARQISIALAAPYIHTGRD